MPTASSRVRFVLIVGQQLLAAFIVARIDCQLLLQRLNLDGGELFGFIDRLPGLLLLTAPLISATMHQLVHGGLPGRAPANMIERAGCKCDGGNRAEDGRTDDALPR